jgi:hypothetical protein
MKVWNRLKARYTRGLCRWCQNPRPLGYATCEACRRRLAQYRARRQAAPPCKRCNRPARAGKSYCVTHLRRNAEEARRYRTRKSPAGTVLTEIRQTSDGVTYLLAPPPATKKGKRQSGADRVRRWKAKLTPEQLRAYYQTTNAARKRKTSGGKK